MPAYNEAKTVAGTVKPLVASRVLDRVTVVDDGSKDGTAQAASAAGASVHQMPKNVGKGAAMKSAIEAAVARGTTVFVFFDADLLGLRTDHVHRMVEPVLSRRACMVVGLQDRGPVVNAVQPAMPLISGQRACSIDVLRRVPDDFWQGYKIEMGLNRAAELTGPSLCFVCDGMTAINKTAKVGAADGTMRNLRMMQEVLSAMHQATVELR